LKTGLLCSPPFFEEQFAAQKCTPRLPLVSFRDTLSRGFSRSRAFPNAFWFFPVPQALRYSSGVFVVTYRVPRRSCKRLCPNFSLLPIFVPVSVSLLRALLSITIFPPPPLTFIKVQSFACSPISFFAYAFSPSVLSARPAYILRDTSS